MINFDKLNLKPNQNYLNTNLTEEKIDNEDWDCTDILITLLLDYF